MCTQEFEIVYRNDSLIAINKPAGILVHRSAIDFHEPHNAQDQLTQQIGGPVFPVHRLDKPTSGVLLFALNKKTAAQISELFRLQQVSKRYLAVVRGHTDDHGSIDNPVRDKDAPEKPRKEAASSYTTLAHMELPVEVDRYATARYSLIEVMPLSGRRHQIRQHMKHISHPLIGDTSYGKTIHNKFFREHLGCSRLLLHAHKLCFKHPGNSIEDEISIEASNFDMQFLNILQRNEWQWLANANINESTKPLAD